MQLGEIVDLDAGLAMQGVKLGLEYKLPLADSVMLATARVIQAILWTQDEDCKGLTGVRYQRK